MPSPWIAPVAEQHARFLGRKGAARMALIPEDVLQALQLGAIPTANLNEFLAVNLAILVPAVVNAIGLQASHERLVDTLAMLGSFKPLKRHALIAHALYDMTACCGDPDGVAWQLATHPSDIARGWASQWVAFSGWPLARQLQAQVRFAADPHFGVREMAWVAVRNEVLAHLEEALILLQTWVQHGNENMRRFATELTRPKGVWCAPIRALQAHPAMALDLLEPLKADPSRYVQNSVANWLNDASKTQGPWVEAVCERWLRESHDPATRYIVRRARRTMDRA